MHLALLAVASILIAESARAQEAMSIDISVSRQIQSQGVLPAVGDYVQYDVTVTNSGQSTITDQSMWVRLASDEGGTRSQAAFSLKDLVPGQSIQIHAGPFKTIKAGEHSFSIGINTTGSPDRADDVMTNLRSGTPADSFIVYSPALATALPVGAGLAAAGAIILSLILSRRRT